MRRRAQRQPCAGPAVVRRLAAVLSTTLLLVTGAAGGERSASHAADVVDSRAAPVASALPRVSVVPPGEPLPSEAECARRVTPTPEDRPDNFYFNRRTGGSRSLPADFFDPRSHDARAQQIAARVTGRFTGTTPEILQWAACKWGLDPRVVVAQATVESFRRSSYKGDWTRDARYCAPGHALGADRREGWCPESWGIMQVRYRYFSGAFPAAIRSTAYNVDTAFAVWRACYEGYEHWLAGTAPGGDPYRPGDLWGCVGRWYSGQWRTPMALGYIESVQSSMADGIAG